MPDEFVPFTKLKCHNVTKMDCIFVLSSWTQGCPRKKSRNPNRINWTCKNSIRFPSDRWWHVLLFQLQIETNQSSISASGIFDLIFYYPSSFFFFHFFSFLGSTWHDFLLSVLYHKHRKDFLSPLNWFLNWRKLHSFISFSRIFISTILQFILYFQYYWF